MKQYDTLDNGGRAFRVKITPQSLRISDANGFIAEYDKYIDVFVGESPKHGQTFKGNSILAEIKPLKYIFIGARIIQFAAKTQIVSFISTVGESGVSYPYAIDADGNIYLLTENKILMGVKTKNPYEYYYSTMPRRSRLRPKSGSKSMSKSKPKPRPKLSGTIRPLNEKVIRGYVTDYLDDELKYKSPIKSPMRSKFKSTRKRKSKSKSKSKSSPKF